MPYQQNREPEFPKPYDFVPFAKEGPQQIRRTGHESFHMQNHLSGRLVIEVVAKTAVHVSSGTYALSEDLGREAGHIVRDFLKTPSNEGKLIPIIPGSTLKGMTRAVVEAVSRSCVIVAAKKTTDDLPDQFYKEIREDEYRLKKCSDKKMCVSCGLFGTMGHLARISFSDAKFASGDLIIVEMPRLYCPRPEKRKEYRIAGQFIGRKFYMHGQLQRHPSGGQYEALQTDTVMTGSIDFTSLTQSELGLLCFGLGLDASFQPGLGGGKPVAMGRVQIQASELQLRQPQSFVEWDSGNEVFTGESLEKVISDFISQGSHFILDKQRDKIRRILDPNNQRPAPTGTY